MRAFYAIVHIGTNLHDNGQPVLPLAGGGAGVAAPPAAPAFAGLLGLLGGLGHGAVAGGAAAVAALMRRAHSSPSSSKSTRSVRRTSSQPLLGTAETWTASRRLLLCELACIEPLLF